MLLDDFREQVEVLSECYEMASLEACLAYLKGEYAPKRELCLLTFDDGLREHFAEVTPVLQERGIQGIFHVITGCSGEGAVAPVHMNHFLMASMEFQDYRSQFLSRMADYDPAIAQVPSNPDLVKKTYPWDPPDVGAFKYLFNFDFNADARDAIVRQMFREVIGPEREFSKELYFNWEEARQMQRVGMVIGGHTHEHRPLAALSGAELQRDLRTCDSLLRSNLLPQAVWPFCYPYGKSDSFPPASIEMLKKLGFQCGFTTESGGMKPGADVFTIRRFDCKKAPVTTGSKAASSGGAA
ncbi:MAG: polysaccharide deacetylase family protein [Candidatus Solibacter sp.]